MIIGLALAVLGLGAWGYMSEEDLGFSDGLYKSVQLFGLAGGDVPLNAPPALEVARWLAPLLVGYAAIRGLLALSRQQLRLVGFRLFRRDHVVVVGLGDVGFRLATSLSDAGARVIAIDSDPANPAFEGCRERGMGFLAGDGTDLEVLDAARVANARYLIIACGIDAVNVTIADAATQILDRTGRGDLTAYVHIENRALWRSLEAQTLTKKAHPGFRLRPFNVYEAAVRLLLEEHPPFPVGTETQSTRVVVAADEWYTETLVVNIVRLWQDQSASSRAKAEITVASPSATQERDRILRKYPRTDDIVNLAAWDTDLTSAAVGHDRRAREATAVYVALSDEAQGVAAALLLRAVSALAAEVVLAVTDEEHGAAGGVSMQEQSAGKIAVFGVLTRALDPGFLFRGLNEALARAMHESYRRGQRFVGETADENRSLASWEELDESLKASNRRFADGIGPKLQAVGCVAVPMPLVEPGESEVDFSADEVELLAKLEHQRWMDDLIRDGWTRGEGKQQRLKTHHRLVPWEQLPEHEREKDRQAIRDLPELLAAAGFELYRVPQPADRSPQRALNPDRPVTFTGTSGES